MDNKNKFLIKLLNIDETVGAAKNDELTAYREEINALNVDDSVKVFITKELVKIATRIRNNRTRVILIRGLPGSGKSCLARHIQLMLTIFDKTCSIHEADSYMGEEFDPKRLTSCHFQCQDSVKDSLAKGHIAIVANTNIKLGEMEVYRLICDSRGITKNQIMVIEPFTPWKYNMRVCRTKTHRRIPSEVFDEYIRYLMEHPTREGLLDKMRGAQLPTRY